MKRSLEEEESSPVLNFDVLGAIATFLDFETLANFRRTCKSFHFAVRKLGEEYFRMRWKRAKTFFYRGTRSIPNCSYRAPTLSYSLMRPFAVSGDEGFHVIDGNNLKRERVIPVSWDYSGPPGQIARTRNRVIIRRGGLSYWQPTNTSFLCSDGRSLNFLGRFVPATMNDRYVFFAGSGTSSIRVDLETMTSKDLTRFNDIYYRKRDRHPCTFVYDDTCYEIAIITDRVRSPENNGLWMIEGTDYSMRFYTSLSLHQGPKLAFVDSIGDLVVVTETSIYRATFDRIACDIPFEEQSLIGTRGTSWIPCRFGDDVLVIFQDALVLHRYARGHRIPFTQELTGRLCGFAVSNVRDRKLAIGSWGKEAFDVYELG